MKIGTINNIHVIFWHLNYQSQDDQFKKILTVYFLGFNKFWIKYLLYSKSFKSLICTNILHVSGKFKFGELINRFSLLSIIDYIQEEDICHKLHIFSIKKMYDKNIESLLVIALNY